MTHVQTSVEASLARAGARLRRHVANPGRARAVDLELNKVDSTTELVYTRYPPTFSFVLAGRKRSIVGDHDQQWGVGTFLITPVDLPVIAGVVQTGPEGDFLSANWRLDPLAIADMASAVAHRTGTESERLGRMTEPLADAVDRLFGLLDAPEDIPTLYPLIARELVYRLLQSDQAPRLLAASTSSSAGVVAHAIDAMTEDLAHPWTLARLSALVGVSSATLTRRFGDLTGMAPMQYLKRIRLGEARRRMLVLGESAARASSAVGYVSASHFSRDYRAMYEITPSGDIDAWQGRIRSLR